MGARKWVRGADNQGSTVVQGPAAQPAVKHNVWRRGQAASAGPQPVQAQHSSEQPAAKRGQASPSQPPVKRGRTTATDQPASSPGPSTASQGPGLPLHTTADGAQLQSQRDALERKIQQQQALLRSRLAGANTDEALRQQQKAKAKARLDAGFAKEFHDAQRAAAASAAAEQHRKPPPLADAQEVARVLAAKSDLECLQLHPGASRADLKTKYRTMAVALHPDKCKVPGSTDAFQRVGAAYKALLSSAG